MKKTVTTTQKQVQKSSVNTVINETQDDYFLSAIKKKGFCHNMRREQLKQSNMRVISVDELQQRTDRHLFSYIETESQSQPFSNYLIQKLLHQQSDLNYVEQELIGMWNCIEQNKSQELLVNVYSNFLNDVFTANHIAFFTQTHKVIDQVINGDISNEQNAVLATLYVKVERVVDIVEAIFKMSSALSLFEGTSMLEVPFSQLQLIIQSLLMSVKIVYQQGQGHINAQDLQIQCLLEFEKLKIKFAGLKRRGSGVGKDQQSTNGTNATQGQAFGNIDKNRTYLPVDSILYPKNTVKQTDNDRKGGRRRGMNNDAMVGLTGLQGYAAAGRQVFMLMNQKSAEKGADPRDLHFEPDQSIELHRGVNPVEIEIQQKIDKMINTKKLPPKKYKNNPPTRSLLKIEKSESDDEEDLIGVKHKFLLAGMGTAKNSEKKLKMPPYHTNFNHGFERSNSREKDFRPPSYQAMETKQNSDKKQPQQPIQHQQQFQNFQVKKMYNEKDVFNFGSAETKLKQLQLRLRESEQQKAEMQHEINKLNKELRDQQGNIPFKLVSKLETNLSELVGEMTEEFNEHEFLIKKHKESQINLLDRKNLVKSLIQNIFKAIGQEQAYIRLEKEITAGKRVSMRGGSLVYQQVQVTEPDDIENSDNSVVEIDPKESVSGLIFGFKKQSKKQMEENIETKPKIMPLPADLKMDSSYIQLFKNIKSFQIYSIIEDYKPTDSRHLVLTKGTVVNGFSKVGDWVCGFLDNNKTQFGFAHLSMLKFEKGTRSGTPSRNTTPTRNKVAPKQLQDALQIHNYLQNLYDDAIEETQT